MRKITDIEDKEVRDGVYLALRIRYLEIRREKISEEICAMSQKLAVIAEEKQLMINEEICRISKKKKMPKEKKTT